MNYKQSQSNSLLFIGGIITVITTFVILWKFPVLTQHFELKIMDLKFSMRSYMQREPDMNSDIVLIALDDASKIASGNEYIWDNKYYAETIKKITEGGPQSYGLDFFFARGCDTTDWSHLINEVGESFMAVNPYLVEFGSTREPFEINKHREIVDELFDNQKQIGAIKDKHVIDIKYKIKQELLNVSSGLGFVNIEPDPDGVLRRLPIVAELNGLLVPHFFLKLLCEHLGYNTSNIEFFNPYKLILHNFPNGDDIRNLEIPLDGRGNMLINYLSEDKIQYQIKAGQFTSFRAWDFIQYHKALDLTGKTVIFGDHSLAARDLSQTPLDGLLNNPLIFGIAMSNILNETFIEPIEGLASIYQIIFLLIILMICATQLKTFEFGVISFLSMMLYICINFSMFIYFGLQIPLLIVLVPILAATTHLLIYNIYQSQLKMGVLEGSLQSYLSPHLMGKLKNDPDMMKLGGARKRISVLFSDIVGFTTFTDQADPEEVQAVLEEYFSEMASIVFENNGIVDKFMGDGILAFFENPPDAVTSAQLAVKSALQMKEKAVILNKKYYEQKRFPFSIYVGIATGYAKVGNIGPPEKMDYTIIGSPVNRASRLDGTGEPGDILMDEDTYFFVKDDYEIEDFGEHNLKGFEKPVKVYKMK